MSYFIGQLYAIVNIHKRRAGYIESNMMLAEMGWVVSIDTSI